ncbi:VPLPA-CTERM sorting domain-containing protein [Pseudooceanicola batsensis]|nr:VPLPA-CTERM sorting domain-containing protein [Pseudooceanicola batsensis]
MASLKCARAGLAAFAVAATIGLTANTANAGSVQVTLDFGTLYGDFASPYVEDGFEIAGSDLFIIGTGNPPSSIFLDALTTSLTLTRTGGGAFSLISFDYSCGPTCDFSVGSQAVTSGSTAVDDYATLTPLGFTDVTSVLFSRNSNEHRLDNIVVSYDTTVVPLPASAAFLLTGLAGFGAMRRRARRKAA